MPFSSLICERVESYVYALLDPDTDKPFYIGKGVANRVFSHVDCALDSPIPSDKYDKIREITSAGKVVRHVILRHGLSPAVALEVESALIDFANLVGLQMTNAVLGHGSSAVGLMTADEVTRTYSTEPLDQLEPGFVLININKTFRRAKGASSYYEATKESWVISERRIPTIHHVLAEYRGFVVEVFRVENWYRVSKTTARGDAKTRWGFEGVVADSAVRDRYLNRLVPRKMGAANPIRYRLA